MSEHFFGATGKFPEGKLNADDEGELQLGIANDGQKIIVQFGTPVSWFGLGPVQARDFASLLIHHAHLVEQAGKSGVTIHILHEGRALCGFTNKLPGDWPQDQLWVSSRENNVANCAGCTERFKSSGE